MVLRALLNRANNPGDLPTPWCAGVCDRRRGWCAPWRRVELGRERGPYRAANHAHGMCGQPAFDSCNWLWAQPRKSNLVGWQVVVCAGVKSILDIGRTLEYLETQVAQGG